MRNYFYTDGQTRFGPFSIDEMKRKRLPGHTLVWYQGLNDWMKISEIPELEFGNRKKNWETKNNIISS